VGETGCITPKVNAEVFKGVIENVGEVLAVIPGATVFMPEAVFGPNGKVNDRDPWSVSAPFIDEIALILRGSRSLAPKMLANKICSERSPIAEL
jgi:hypothetical protein